MIIGKTVRFRAIEEHDLEALQGWLNDPEISRLVGGFSFPVSAAGQRRWFEASQSNATTQRWIVEDHAGLRLGLVGLWQIDWHNRNAMAAIKLGSSDARGRGYGTDALMSLAAYAFYQVGLHKLWAEILPFNVASYRVFVDKCGWQVEGVYRQHVFREGCFHDQVRVGLLREDFDALEGAGEYTPDATLPVVQIAPEHRAATFPAAED